jgi:hypothetical protein
MFEILRGINFIKMWGGNFYQERSKQDQRRTSFLLATMIFSFLVFFLKTTVHCIEMYSTYHEDAYIEG